MPAFQLTCQHFLDPAYAEKYPSEANNTQRLRQAILDYARTIQRGLVILHSVNKDIAFYEALRQRKSSPEL